jgi:hypothetical protein
MFEEIIRDGNAKGWFKALRNPSAMIKLPLYQLLRDVKTRSAMP